MILNNFNNYLLENPDIAKEYKVHKQCTKQRLGEDETGYKNAVSNFINGVINYAYNKDILISGNNLIIRTACLEDLHFMNEVEQDKDNSPWVGNWTVGWRIEKFGDNDFLQTIIETKNGKAIGIIIFRDMVNYEKQIELKRIALIEKGKGYGKEALYLSQKLAFEVFKTNRLYLGTKKENIRAQTIYKKTGFIPDTPDPCVYFNIYKSDYLNMSGINCINNT